MDISKRNWPCSHYTAQFFAGRWSRRGRPARAPKRCPAATLGWLTRTRVPAAHLPGPGLEMLEILGAGDLGDGVLLPCFVDLNPQVLDLPTQSLLAKARLQDQT